MVMSCRTSSYFSSIVSAIASLSPQRNRAGPHQVLHAPFQGDLFLEQRTLLRIVRRAPELLADRVDPGLQRAALDLEHAAQGRRIPGGRVNHRQLRDDPRGLAVQGVLQPRGAHTLAAEE